MAMPMTDELLIGDQRPRLVSVPPAGISYDQGEDAIAFGRRHGLNLYEWQEWALRESMAVRQDGHWAASEIGWVIPRQNGKNEGLLVRQLAGLYILGEALQIHTAHEFKAAGEHFLRIQQIIEGSSELLARVKRGGIRTSHGEEAILLRPTPTLIWGPGGRQIRRSVAPRLRFLARSRGSGRSFTANTVYYDEAMILSDEEVSASMPTLRTVPNHQMWFTASAGMPDSFQLYNVRKRGIAGTDPDLFYAEWSCEYCPDLCPDVGRPLCRYGHDRRDQPRSWARANPSMGLLVSEETMAKEYRKMTHPGFDREILGIGDWPVEDMAWSVISEHNWNSNHADEWERPAKLAVSVDITPAMTHSCIVIAGVIPGDGRIGVEIPQQEMPDGATYIDHRAGVDWILPRLKDLKESYRSRMKLVIDPIGPGAELIVACTNAGLEVEKCTLRDVAQAHSQLLRAVEDHTLVHRGQKPLNDAVAAGVQRDVGDGQHAWARRDTEADISPLCAMTMAHWLAHKIGAGYDLLTSVALPTREPDA